MTKLITSNYKCAIIFISAFFLLSCSAKKNLEWGWYHYDRGDTCTGVKFFRKAALEEDAEALYMMAYVQEHEECYEKNIENAFLLYASSASKGYLKAQKKMGEIFYRGEWIEKDYKQAFYWHEKAAQQGDDYSQYTIGFMYANGQGVKANSDTATIWLAKSVRAGSQEGMNELLKLQKDGNAIANQEMCTLYKEKKISTSNYLVQQCKGQ